MKHQRNPTVPSKASPTAARPATEPAADHSAPDAPTVTADDIRLRAYRKWEQAGSPQGDGLEFWLRAEHELPQGR